MIQGGGGIAKMSKVIIPICEHIKDDGNRCGSPALRRRKLCYFHDKEYRRHRIPKTAACYLIRSVSTDRDIRAATASVLRAARQGLFTAQDLKTMLYGLQVARSVLPAPRGRKRRIK